MHGWEDVSNRMDGEMTEWRRTSVSDHERGALDRGECTVEIGRRRPEVVVRAQHIWAVRSRVSRSDDYRAEEVCR